MPMDVIQLGVHFNPTNIDNGTIYDLAYKDRLFDIGNNKALPPAPINLPLPIKPVPLLSPSSHVTSPPPLRPTFTSLYGWPEIPVASSYGNAKIVEESRKVEEAKRKDDDMKRRMECSERESKHLKEIVKLRNDLNFAHRQVKSLKEDMKNADAERIALRGEMQRLQNQPRSPHPNYPYPQAAQNELRNDFVVASSVPDDPNLRNKQGNQHQSNPYQIQNRGCHPPPQPQNPPIQKNVPESLKRKFVPPKKIDSSTIEQSQQQQKRANRSNPKDSDNDELPEELQHLDPELYKSIMYEIMSPPTHITFDSISGLKSAKKAIFELVIWPLTRPDLFTGLRSAANGLLLFGPPGTGKTLIGKAIASESKSTFFSISSSSLTSKWIGQGEKLVRTLFSVAAYKSPSVVFVDEVDSLLIKRSEGENEASRRIKTEFLVQLDGTKETGGRVLLIGATNRPAELDDAARRRFVKRLYIPLPDYEGRVELIKALLKGNHHELADADIEKLASKLEGFSGADLKSLCNDASMGPIRDMGKGAMQVKKDQIPPIAFRHFKKSLKKTRPSVAKDDLVGYDEFNKEFGGLGVGKDDDDDDDNDDDDETEVLKAFQCPPPTIQK